ncbi:transcriptional regulator [Rhizobium sp. AC27/96]|nr:transcriptional regulator [Rhizobium sp. AC27/96]
MIEPDQIRAARAMLGLTQADLAKAAGISTTGLNNIERGTADPKASTLRAIQAALETAGIIFQSDGEMVPGGRGLRIRRSAKSFETTDREMIQYPEFKEGDGGPGSGG